MSIYSALTDAERVRAAINIIGGAVGGAGNNDLSWGNAWREALKGVDPHKLSKSCEHLHFEGSDADKRMASKVGGVVNRAKRFVQYLDEAEHDLANLYPKDEARRRLDEELGWKMVEGEPDPVRLDRAMMLSRVDPKPVHVLRMIAYRKLRSQFTELESMDGWEE